MDLLDEMIQRNIRLEKSVNVLERHKEESQVLINRVNSINNSLRSGKYDLVVALATI